MKKYILLTLAIIHITTLNTAMVPHDPYSKNQSYAADPEHYLSQEEEEEENKENFLPNELIPQRETPSWNPLTIQIQNTYGIVGHKSNTILLDGYLAVCLEKGIVSLFSPTTGSEVKRLNTYNLDSYIDLNPSGDGTLLAVSPYDSDIIHIINAQTGELSSEINNQSSVDKVKFLSNDRLLVSSYKRVKFSLFTNETIKMFDTKTKKCIAEIPHPAFDPFAITSDGQILANPVTIWTIHNDSFKYARTMPKTNSEPSCMVFSPDNTQLAIGSNEQKTQSGDFFSTISIINPHTGQLIHKLYQHIEKTRSHCLETRVDAIAYSGNNRLASGTKNGTLFWWDLLTGQCLGKQKIHRAPINFLAFLPPNGDYLASAAGFSDDTIKISNLSQIKIEEEKKEEELRIKQEKQTSCCIS